MLFRSFDNLAEYKADTDPKDVTPPTLVGVELDASGTIITLLFSEKIDPLTGGILANYKISPNLAITAASVRGEKVVLTTAPQTRDGT